ncbi:MAG: hypothetical protein A2600_08605 [Candidatus Lambdaproteobacteria bacterium RIFOXYD1_FULL_56_27]|uniref:Uncharacterized protein n=1 Tax=Candidatus Lambdaproteobacteria bacterium RIFOXYD2_FULL_56_26 TaxID=1817773 RepID=A0A1F6GZC8_9PROT|nr:MAG: hypothetical protein A2426_10025 [Candidatus Lambdaproteobacteria bacterium RIFOXYC1_FULL_56_13]OGH03404.1 MAG: hypothetical protein A2557_02660 [Candidatus Lambdaproteobacteria bacterium RIFOXYD2_FULL_56_26]OGH06591.1 MAG: hypothetical protein A2600_08605 [Candidatus Lambdaproteobacteria bacterium RIFOXYD1_FULL_56_27]
MKLLLLKKSPSSDGLLERLLLAREAKGALVIRLDLFGPDLDYRRVLDQIEALEPKDQLLSWN